MIRLTRRALLCGTAAAPFTVRVAQRPTDRLPRQAVALRRRLPARRAERSADAADRARHRRAAGAATSWSRTAPAPTARSPAASVAKAPTDGSVFMLASNGSTTVAAALNKSLPYDIRTDFAAVAPVGINPMLLVVRPDLPAKNVAELLAMAHERPGKLNGASAGAGGATHLALELFKSLGKADIVHVPYKGGGPAMADLMASMVDIYFGGLSTALPHVKAGKLQALGQTGEKRSAAAPDIPTIAEFGLAGLRGRDLLRRLPAGRRLAGIGRQAARCRGRNGPLARGGEEVRRPRRRSAVRHAEGVRGLRRERHGQMGPRRQGRGPQGD